MKSMDRYMFYIHSLNLMVTALKAVTLLTQIKLRKQSVVFVNSPIAPISKFPSVSRDLAFVLDAKIAAGDLIRAVKKVGGSYVVGCEVFDIYQGANIAEGKKSMAISVTYRKEDGTLTEKEVSDAEEKIKFELSRNFKAEIRG